MSHNTGFSISLPSITIRVVSVASKIVMTSRARVICVAVGVKGACNRLIGCNDKRFRTIEADLHEERSVMTRPFIMVALTGARALVKDRQTYVYWH